MDNSELPFIGDPNFTLHEGSVIIMQTDENLASRMAEYLNETMEGTLSASMLDGNELIQINCSDPKVALQVLYKRYSLIRYLRRYMITQETVDQLSWPVISSLATKLNIDLSKETIRLSVYPKKLVESTIDVILNNVSSISPTNSTVILTVIYLPNAKYMIGFAPTASCLDHHEAIRILDASSTVNRAYYKLEEAIERVPVVAFPQPSWNAVDIGASPGGWSLYCSKIVGKVYAIDPGAMQVTAPNIIHMPTTFEVAAACLPEDVLFNLVVCDINAYPTDSLPILARVKPRLAPGALIIWTLKYPKRFSEAGQSNRLNYDSQQFLKQFPTFCILKVSHLLANKYERTLIAIDRGNSSPSS